MRWASAAAAAAGANGGRQFWSAGTRLLAPSLAKESFVRLYVRWTKEDDHDRDRGTLHYADGGVYTL